jgi:hypothetical protein
MIRRSLDAASAHQWRPLARSIPVLSLGAPNCLDGLTAVAVPYGQHTRQRDITSTVGFTCHRSNVEA